jgi:PEGA domain
MGQLIGIFALFLVMFVHPAISWGQSTRTTPPQPQPQPQPQRGQRGTTAKPPEPLTLRQVIEALSAQRGNPRRAEDLVSKAGVQFQASPAVLDILKEFGASPKLLSMIPAPPPPPPTVKPPAPRVAGPLTVICEPKDCNVVIDNRYEGVTDQNRKTINGLPPGTANVTVFADGYENVTRQVQLQEDKAAEEKFSIKRSMLVRQAIGSASFLETMATMGGAEGLAVLGDIEGTGTLQWTNSDRTVEEWAVTFQKHIGPNLSVTYKAKDGQCTASISGQTAKQECRGELRNRGEKIAEQGTALFLSYQLPAIIHALLSRPVIASEMDNNRLESSTEKDSYVLTLGKDGLISDLVYRIGSADMPIQVRYSNYLNLNPGRYPGRISMGRLNGDPAWVFNLKTVRSKVLKDQ